MPDGNVDYKNFGDFGTNACVTFYYLGHAAAAGSKRKRTMVVPRPHSSWHFITWH